jgi:capsular polysaccharide transport system permease protein
LKQILSWLNPKNLRISTIIVPWLVGALYLYAFAADRFISESVLAVRSNTETPTIISGLSAIFPTAGNSMRSDSLTLRSYIHSSDMLEVVDKRLDLRTAYSAPRSDFWFRLDKSANREELMKYYRDRVDVQYDDDSGLLTIRTEAFDPQYSARLNSLLIELSERFINETSHRIARAQMDFSQSEQVRAQEALEKAKQSVQAFQNQNGMLDPLAQAQANTGVTVELQATLARQEAELKGLLGYLSSNAPQVNALRLQIAGTRAQLEAEKKRGTASGAKLNVLAGEFEALAARLQFAEDAYKVATAAFENARIESVRKLKTLVAVQTPGVPQKAEQPRRAYSLIALFLGLSLLYGIVRLVVATIEDHLG